MTCILLGNRLFTGFTGLNHPIRCFHELDMILNKGTIVGQENNGNPNLGFLGPNNYFGVSYQPVKMDEIPNFLSGEWAVI